VSATWIEEDGKLVLIPMTGRSIREQMGSLKGKTSVFDDFFRERRRERMNEEKRALRAKP
jgi:hypothetical protein